MIRRTILLSLCMVVLTAGAAQAGKQAAREAYFARDMKTAVSEFQKAVAESPNDADLHAWLALAQWRNDEWTAAFKSAKRAVKLDDNSSFAHSVLGRVYNPQFSSAQGTDADKSWQHLKRAVELDNSNGDAWCILWPEAMRRGEVETERKALEALLNTGFFTPCVMNYARWTLEQLPENALLLTNGDLDTYPMVALQSARSLRPDVAIVNLSLMNLSWYIELMCKRHSLPVPAVDIEAMEPKKADDGSWILINRQTAEAWRDMAASGYLDRPLAAAITIPMSYALPEVGDAYTFAGPYLLLEGGGVNLERLQQSLAAADTLDFGGPTRNPADTSPLRDGAGVLMNITATALKLLQAYLQADRPEDAYETALWAERFEKKSSATPMPSLAMFKEMARKAVEEKKLRD